jgi:hypothetical protein
MYTVKFARTASDGPWDSQVRWHTGKKHAFPPLTHVAPEERLITSKVQGRDICSFLEPMSVLIFGDVTDRSKLDCSGVVQQDEKDQCCEELEWPPSGHDHDGKEGIKIRL